MDKPGINLNFEPKLSDLDFERFGVRTAKAEVSRVEDAARCIEQARAKDVSLIIIRTPTDALSVVQEFEARGALLTDCLIYYRRKVDAFAHDWVHNGYRYRFADSADGPAVAALARQTFAGYQGHYHADPRLPSQTCDEVYESWALRSCTVPGVADKVIVAEAIDSGELAAFATLRYDAAESSVEGVLFGVAPQHQGRGIYRHLIRSMHATASAESMRKLLVSTQITNMSVQRSWVKEGYEPFASLYTLHLWLD